MLCLRPTQIETFEVTLTMRADELVLLALARFGLPPQLAIEFSLWELTTDGIHELKGASHADLVAHATYGSAAQIDCECPLAIVQVGKGLHLFKDTCQYILARKSATPLTRLKDICLSVGRFNNIMQRTCCRPICDQL